MTDHEFDGLDDVLGLGVGLSDAPPGDDDSSHLEIDDLQTKEIRQIFLATLPDYLEPVKQMVRQLFAGGEGVTDIRRTLDTTLASIAEAASRVEITDVAETIERARQRLEQCDDSADEEIRDAIWSDLEDIEQIAGIGSTGSGAGSSRAPAQTIVAAFQELEGVDRSVLERLTAAGLVTVDQIRMADPSEIVAVTGLPPEVVKRLVRALVADADDAASPDSAGPAPAPGDPLAAGLSRQLRTQVDAEVQLADLRGELLQQQVTVRALRDELATVEQQCSELRAELAARRQEVAEQLARLSSERARRERLERRRADAERARARGELELEQLGQEHAALDDAQSGLAQTLGGLVSKVERMLQAVATVEVDLETRVADGSTAIPSPRGRR